MKAAAQRQRLTVRLSPELYAATQEAVRLGLAPNQNSFIEEAIRRCTREIRHLRLRRLADEAMKDPGFVADMRGTMVKFAHVDRENWPLTASAEKPRKSPRRGAK